MKTSPTQERDGGRLRRRIPRNLSISQAQSVFSSVLTTRLLWLAHPMAEEEEEGSDPVRCLLLESFLTSPREREVELLLHASTCCFAGESQGRRAGGFCEAIRRTLGEAEAGKERTRTREDERETVPVCVGIDSPG